jgi:exosortase A-associated hydrolase 1
LNKLEAVDLVSPAVPIFLAEIAPQFGRALSPMVRKLVEAWADAGVDVETRVVQGAQFWSTQEIALVPELLEETGNWFSGVTSHLQCRDLPSLLSSRTNQGAGEIPLVFPCDGDEMVGILHTASPEATTAVLVVVGGPQYRVGSHRQFVHLARDLARAGIPVLRFDYRGMGDSAGALRDFRTIGEDIDSAMDALHQALPDVQRVVIWGLCDAATAACSYAYAYGDDRVAGLVLLNPWVHSEQGEARAYLKHYYVRRFFDAQFWKKMLSGDFQWRDSLGSLGENFNKARQASGIGEEGSVPLGSGLDHHSIDNLAERMYQNLHKYRHKVLLIMSGNDLTAAEFLDASGTNRKFRRLLASRRFSWCTLREADHTFSRDEWRKQVAQWTINWVKSL